MGDSVCHHHQLPPSQESGRTHVRKGESSTMCVATTLGHTAQLAIPAFADVSGEPSPPRPDCTGQDASTVPVIAEAQSRGRDSSLRRAPKEQQCEVSGAHGPQQSASHHVAGSAHAVAPRTECKDQPQRGFPTRRLSGQESHKVSQPLKNRHLKTKRCLIKSFMPEQPLRVTEVHPQAVEDRAFFSKITAEAT